MGIIIKQRIIIFVYFIKMEQVSMVDHIFFKQTAIRNEKSFDYNLNYFLPASFASITQDREGYLCSVTSFLALQYNQMCIPAPGTGWHLSKQIINY